MDCPAWKEAACAVRLNAERAVEAVAEAGKAAWFVEYVAEEWVGNRYLG